MTNTLEDKFNRAMIAWEKAFLEAGGRMTLLERDLSRKAYARYHEWKSEQEFDEEL